MIMRSLPLLLLLFFPLLVTAHQTVWMPGMFAFNGPTGCNPTNGDCESMQVNPIGPGLTSQEEWWFRGSNYTDANALPAPSNATVLPAGGTWTTEITCHKAFTSYGSSMTAPDAPLSCCPTGAGPYHADYNALIVNASLISGCALAIADVMTPAAATMDNMAIFSVQPDCVKQRVTTFDIPADMPACTGEYCICGWFWLANTGTANFYMTGFYCKITRTGAGKKISTPQVPAECLGTPEKCVSGAKTPLFAYNTPTNVLNPQNSNRPGYHAGWSFTNMGAQNDIFEGSSTSNSTAAASSGTASAAGGGTSKASAVAPISQGSATQDSTATGTAAGNSDPAAGTGAATPTSGGDATTSPAADEPGSTAADSSPTGASSAAAASSTSSSSTSISFSSPIVLAVCAVLLLGIIGAILYALHERSVKGDEEKAVKHKHKHKKASSSSSSGSSSDEKKALAGSSSDSSTEISSDSDSGNKKRKKKGRGK